MGAAEKKVTSKLLEPSARSEKMYKVDDHVAVAVAGITADANILINYARRAAQGYQYTYAEPMPIEQLVNRLCNLKQSYTQYGGLRPFGASILKQDYDEESMPLDTTLTLAVKVLKKTMDSTTLTHVKVDIATLSMVDGEVVFRELPADEVDALIEAYEAAEAEEDN